MWAVKNLFTGKLASDFDTGDKKEKACFSTERYTICALHLPKNDSNSPENTKLLKQIELLTFYYYSKMVWEEILCSF